MPRKDKPSPIYTIYIATNSAPDEGMTKGDQKTYTLLLSNEELSPDTIPAAAPLVPIVPYIPQHFIPGTTAPSVRFKADGTVRDL